MRVVSGSVKETLNIGKAIARSLEKADIICLFGQLGSGKTVLTKGLAAGLGVKEKVISPSFVLLRQYPGARASLNHFDLYRLSARRDILTLGYEEYFYDDAITVIEWADRLKHLLPEEYLKVKISIGAGSKRVFIITGIGKRYEELTRKINEDIGA